MAFNDNKQEIKIIARKYADMVKEEITSVEAIYLFGSHINGNPMQDSDIDIAVISEDFGKDIVEETLKLMRIRRKVDTRIEPHPLRTDNPFVKDVIASGLKVG
ncbi:MAG: nucleotidyltransferase domain-containing protein [Syntrophomonadaceae bacterium]|nr:nucleotidyltransferase domain-containing protein [Syntrophomonadaceae bacterium]